MNIREAMKNQIILIDGAMGTMIQSAGLKAGEQPEVYNMTHPEIIEDIHRKYVKAGANVITTNTFGANEYKLEGTGYSPEEIVERAVSLAKKVAGEKSWVALDIGPVGQLMAPMGTLSFDDVSRVVQRQVKAGVRAGADLVIIETVSDLYEMKAAILSVKENSNLPIFCTLTYSDGGRTMMGTDPLTAVNVLEGLGVDALGANCSQGPKELLPIAKELISHARIPVMIQPNAGLPRLVDGNTVFDTSKEEFTYYTGQMLKEGVRIIGGCCGTNPDFIEELKKFIVEFKAENPEIDYGRGVAVSSASNTVVIGEGLQIIGGAINPYLGGESIQKAFLEEDFDTIVSEAIEQRMDGAKILDINVGLAGPSTGEKDLKKDLMIKTIGEVQTMVNTPLMIDSENGDVLEAGIRIVNGTPLIRTELDSVHIIDGVFSISNKYGSPILFKPFKEENKAWNMEEILDRGKTILEAAEKHGVPKARILLEPFSGYNLASPNLREDILKDMEKVNNILGIKMALEVNEDLKLVLGDFEEDQYGFFKSAEEKGLAFIIASVL